MAHRLQEERSEPPSAPGNIVLGRTTAGIMGQEGKVLQKVLPITLAAAAIVGVDHVCDVYFVIRSIQFKSNVRETWRVILVSVS